MNKNNSTEQATLHQLFSADPRALNDCLSFVCSGDEILLISDGVYLLGRAAELRLIFDRHGTAIKTSALSADVQALGLEQEAKRKEFEMLSDLEWLERIQAHRLVLSWN